MSAHYVYRVYAHRYDLIYVGCTQDLRKRLHAHSKTSWWAPQATKVVAKVYPDKAAGLAAEVAAIREELPRWNTRGKEQLTSGWARKHFVTYVSAALADGELPTARLMKLHRLANVYRREYRRSLPVELPSFALAAPAQERRFGGFIAKRLTAGGWVIYYGDLVASLALPGDSNFDWVYRDFVPVRAEVSA